MTSKYQKGIATLPTILVLSILLLAIGASIAVFGIDATITAQEQTNGYSALAYAETGASDALLKIARNKNYSCTSAGCYQINMATNGCSTSTACAQVTVSSGAGSSADPKIITAIGLSGSNTRKVQVAVVFDASGKGEITSYTWSEQTN